MDSNKEVKNIENKNLEFIKNISSEVSEFILKDKSIMLSPEEINLLLELIKSEIIFCYQIRTRNHIFSNFQNKKIKKFNLVEFIKEIYFR